MSWIHPNSQRGVSEKNKRNAEGFRAKRQGSYQRNRQTSCTYKISWWFLDIHFYQIIYINNNQNKSSVSVTVECFPPTHAQRTRHYPGWVLNRTSSILAHSAFHDLAINPPTIRFSPSKMHQANKETVASAFLMLSKCTNNKYILLMERLRLSSWGW